MVAGAATLDAALRLAHELADVADGITLGAFVAGAAAESKSDGTPVTQADLDAERAMRRLLRERQPDHAVLGEEDGLQGPEGAPTWVLDPIDGTKNFTRGIPVFATLIALTDGDRGLAAVVSAPALGTRWDAVAGGPARRDGRPIRVSAVTDLASATVSFGGLNHFERGGLLAGVAALTRATARQRGFGDFWQHCLVAGGAVDVAVEAAVSRWDLAAPKLLVEAAGGRFTDLGGAATDTGGSAVATNGALHDPVLELLRTP